MAKTKQPKWTKEEIRAMLVKSDKAVIKGLITIYGYQTADEKAVGATVEDNGMGFSGVDSQFLSDLARKYQKYQSFTQPQIECVRKCMLKYAGQLARHANAYHPKAPSV